MALVTGTILDFTTSVLSLSPRLIFKPSNPTAYVVAETGFVFATKDVEVIPGSDGSFEASLFANEQGFTPTYYTLVIEWLNGAGIPTGRDDFPWLIRVPWNGGRLADLIEAPWNPTLAWWGSEPPGGTPMESTLWLDPDTGILSIWSN